MNTYRRLNRSLSLSGLLLAMSTSCLACDPGDDDASIKSKSVIVELDLLSLPVERSNEGLFSDGSPLFRRAMDTIDNAAADDKIKGVFIRIGALNGGWGRLSELVAAFKPVRDAKKHIGCHFDSIDNAGYAFAASVCDEINMTPAGDLDLVGLAAHSFYARQFLENIGLKADLMQMGRYKGAEDPFVRDDMPAEVRESLGGLLDDLQAHLVSAVSKGRDLSSENVAAIINAGPFDSQGATERKLIDHVAFEDEARERTRRTAKADDVSKADLSPQSTDAGFMAILRALGGEGSSSALIDGPHLALVHFEGSISDGEEESDDGVQSGPFVREMHRLRNETSVKAVVLRIDSPGGSALASDRMWHSVQMLARKKPVIVSIGDMAASGGYYVASAGTFVFADQTSIVGSIGVVGGKIVAADLAERVGVHSVLLERGEHSGWSSPTRPFTDSERAQVHLMMERTYARFVARIRAGRGLSNEQIAKGAEGRIMSGQDALALGLVNKLGSLSDALEEARERAHVSRDAEIEEWPAQRTLLDKIAEMSGGPQSNARLARGLLDGHVSPVLVDALLSPLMIGGERVAVVTPFAFDIR